MSTRIAVINGPNLNLLGTRQPEIYGHTTLQDIETQLLTLSSEYNVTMTFFQSNHEGALVDEIHRCRGEIDAIIINPGAYSHTSVAILDALNAYEGIVLEVHLSNIHRRESFRHHSYVSKRADGILCGLGVNVYYLALKYLMDTH